MTRTINTNADFTCAHCGNYVSASYLLAGVQNRNHCPYCLWSRHLDLFQAGDRLSACKAPMQPVGLTLKREHKKYASVGELMLVHLCRECGDVSINRIAADDLSPVLLDVWEDSLGTMAQIRRQFREAGVILLDEADRDVVLRQLYGEVRLPA
jgi:hypothetical protein